MYPKLIALVICSLACTHARTLQISLTGLNFPYEDIFEGYPDLYVVVNYAANANDEFKKVGETAVLEESTDPIWKEQFDFEYVEENSQQRLKLEVFDEDVGNDDLVGVVEIFTLKELVEQSSMTLILGLDPKPNGVIVVKGKFLD